MPSWTITTEHYVVPEAHYRDRPVESIEFFYAIRRKDKSLLFRAGTMKQADELIARLVTTHQEGWVLV